MSAATEVLSDLKSAGITLRIVEGEIAFKAKRGAMTEARREAIKANKAELVSALSEAREVLVVASGVIGAAPRQICWWITEGEAWP